MSQLVLVLVCALTLLVGAATFPAPAAAQEVVVQAADDSVQVEQVDEEEEDRALSGIEEMTITATKREQSLQDVPISVAAISGQTLQEAGVTSFAELQNFVPNLEILPVTDTRSTSIRIRGIGSVGSNAGIDPSVGVFIDGVYQGRAGMSVGDLVDIERVEVLRGPQGTLYGKNTAAGAISVVTKRPNYVWESIAEVVVGNFNNYEFRGSVNAPIVEDTLATRLSGYYVTRDGFDTNRFNGKIVNDANKWGARAKVAWDFADSWSLQLSGDFAQEDNRSFVADIITYAGPSLLNVTFAEMAALPGRPPLPNADPFDRIVGANEEPINFVRVGGAAIDLEGDAFSEHTLRWLTAYRTYSTDSQFDGDFSIYDAVLAFALVDLHQVSSELTITSPGGGRFEYQGGLYFYYSNLNTIDRNGFGGDFTTVWQNKLIPIPDEVSNVNDNLHETYSAAGYGHTTIEIIESLKLTLGARVTWERKSRAGTFTSTFKTLDIPPVLGPDIAVDDSRSVWNGTGKIALQWYPFLESGWSNLAEDTNFYFSFANGFKSGGFNQLRTMEGTNGEFDDELSLNYEVGMRSMWFDRRLTFNLTGFFTDFRDFQAQTFTGTQIDVTNAGRSFNYGIEADLFYAPPIDNLVLGGALGWLIAEYQSFDDAPRTVPDIIDCGGTLVPACQTQDFAGERVANAPRISLTMFAQYEHEVPGLPFETNWFVRTDYALTSQVWLDTDLDDNLRQPTTHILGLRSGFRADDELWEVTFWVKNLADQGWQVAGFDIPIVSGYGAVLAPPRQIGGTLRIKY